MSAQAKKMRVISRSTLKAYWETHPQTKAALTGWHDVITSRGWKGLADFIVAFSNSVDGVGNNRFVFNIGSNFRLVALVNFAAQKAFVRFIGTHKEYDSLKNNISNV